MHVPTRRVVLVSGHYFGSKRRAGFHHLAEAYWRVGWDVTFVTAGISSLSRLGGDYRFEYPVREEANRLVSVRERLSSFVLMARVHPRNLFLPAANRIAAPLFARYARTALGPLEEVVRRADLVIFESTAGLLLVERIRQIAAGARLVYRASDDLRMLGVHPLIVEAEEAALPAFDFVSVPTPAIAEVLAPFAAIHVNPPGIDKAAFDRATKSPYVGGTNAVFAGVSHFFDYETLDAAARLAPTVAFHVIGPSRRRCPDNVVFRPEMPFEEVVPYMQHATFGLLVLPPQDPRLGYGSKVAQYSYCRLPIVAPAHLKVERSNVSVFERGDPESLRVALLQAEQMEHAPAFAEGVLSADELAAVLAGDER